MKKNYTTKQLEMIGEITKDQEVVEKIKKLLDSKVSGKRTLHHGGCKKYANARNGYFMRQIYDRPSTFKIRVMDELEEVSYNWIGRGGTSTFGVAGTIAGDYGYIDVYVGPSVVYWHTSDDWKKYVNA